MASSACDKPSDFRHLLGCIGVECSDVRNTESRRPVPNWGADTARAGFQNAQMTETDWYLREWMVLLGKRQADLVRDLGWTRRKASEVYNGDQPYKREIVNELAKWLGLKPYEMLMTPERANRLRQIEQAAHAIAANSDAPARDLPIAAARVQPTTRRRTPVKKAS